MANQNGVYHQFNKDSAADQEIGEAVSSPYATRAVTVSVGASGAQYTILEAIVDQHPGLKKKLDPFDAQITLREVDEDIGHTLIHYLYTGQYQTLGSASLPDNERTPTEFKRSVLAYCAARLCGIGELEEFAKKKIEDISKDLSIFDIQRVTEEISGKLPRHGDWFSSQVDSWAKAALTADDNLLTNPRIVDAIGRNAIFDKALMKALTEMYTELKTKVKQPVVAGGRTRTVSVEHDESPNHVKTSSISAPRGKLDDDKSTGTQNLPIHASKHQPDTKGTGIRRDSGTAVSTKPHPGEYSPMPSEDQSPFEPTSPTTEKNEKKEKLAQVDDLGKVTDSDEELPQSKLPVSKKGKKKKGKKVDG